MSLFCGIGERSREAEELYREMGEAGVRDKTVMLFGQEWEKTSTEVDEDRQAYVYYCRKTGG